MCYIYGCYKIIFVENYGRGIVISKVYSYIQEVVCEMMVSILSE